MNIGFDLDKVFVDYPPLVPDTIINKLYKKKSNGILLYRIPGRTEQLIRHISHHPIFRPLIKNNLMFLREFSKTKNDLYLISSRFGFLKQRTNDLVKNQEFDKLFKGLYFNYENQQPHVFKDTIIKQLKIEKYIDDDFALVKYLATHNPNVQFYWLNQKQQKKLAKNILAITHLKQIEKPL
jgi:hypothetical protein